MPPNPVHDVHGRYQLLIEFFQVVKRQLPSVYCLTLGRVRNSQKMPQIVAFLFAALTVL